MKVKFDVGRFHVKHFWLGCLFVAGAALVNVCLLHGTRPYQFLEEINFDGWIRANPRPPSAPGKIQILAIDDAGYKNVFNGHSPLDPCKVRELIRLADDGGAKVIGVDLDTSEWTASDWQAVKPARAYVVWAASEAPNPGAGARCEGSVLVSAADVQRSDRRNETGIVRTHPVSNQPLFSDVIARSFRYSARECSGEGSPGSNKPPSGPSRFIPFVSRLEPKSAEPNFEPFPVAALPLGNSCAAPKQEPSPARQQWNEAKPMKGAIVLIGGTASKLNAFHETPFGLESDIGLQADLVNSALAESKALPLTDMEILGFDFVAGLLLSAFLSWELFAFKRWCVRTPVFLIGLLGYGLLLAYISFRFFRGTGLFLGFMPIFLSVLLCELAMFYWEHRKCPECEKRSEQTQPAAKTNGGPAEPPPNT